MYLLYACPIFSPRVVWIWTAVYKYICSSKIRKSNNRWWRICMLFFLKLSKASAGSVWIFCFKWMKVWTNFRKYQDEFLKTRIALFYNILKLSSSSVHPQAQVSICTLGAVYGHREADQLPTQRQCQCPHLTISYPLHLLPAVLV